MLTQKRLKQLLSYDPKTGLFTRISSPKKHRIGTIPGARNTQGHIQIRVDGPLYLAHRLVWLYVYGRFPKDQLDHINGNRTDNRLKNLREVNQKQNTENQKLHGRNISGYRGVAWSSSHGKWRADVTHHYAHYFVGLFSCPKEAGKAAKAKRDELFTHHLTEYSA